MTTGLILARLLLPPHRGEHRSRYLSLSSRGYKLRVLNSRLLLRLNVVFAQLGSTARHRTARHRKHRNVLSSCCKTHRGIRTARQTFRNRNVLSKCFAFSAQLDPSNVLSKCHSLTSTARLQRLWADLYPPKCCKRNVLSSCANTTLGFATFQQNIST